MDAEELIPFDADHFPWLRDPQFQRDWAWLQIKQHIVQQFTGWMRHIPIVGELVYVFWSCLLEEGVVNTCKPRWGALTFSFLNDGMRPTLWHTWYSVVHPYGPYGAIYPHRAPRSRKEAEAWGSKGS